MSLHPDTLKRIEKDAAKSFIENADNIDGNSGRTFIAGYLLGAKSEAGRNQPLIEALEKIKNTIEQDLISNGNNDLGNRIHLEVMIVLKNYNSNM